MGTSSIKLSIIIPYYNTYELTKKLLDSLIPQSNIEMEVILIDDGCNEIAFNDRFRAANSKGAPLQDR